MTQQASLPQADTSLEDRFATYAEQNHPESMEPKEEQVPRETVEAPVETPVETPAAETPEPAETEQPIRFQFESVEELAKQLDVPVDAILALKLKTKVDDQEAEFPLAEIQKGFQLDKHNQNKSKELSTLQEKANQTKAQYEAYNQAIQQNLTNLNALGKYAKEVLIPSQFKDVNWQWLQTNDPTQFIIQREAYKDLNSAVDTYLAQVNQQAQNQQAQVQTRQQAQIQDLLNNRASIRPEWADEGAFNKDTQAIRDTFLSHGFKAEELPTLLTNPAYLAAADAATRWWNLQKQKPEVTAQVRTAPKLNKGVARIGSVKPSNLTNFKAQLRANPKDSDVQEAAFAEWATEASKAGLLG